MGKNLDKELADAAGIGDDAPDDADHSANDTGDAAESMTLPLPPPQKGQPPAAPRGPKNVGLLAVLLTIVVGIVSLFMFGFKEVEVYSMPLAKFASKQSEFEGRRLRIEGELVPGSLTKRDDPCEYRFRLRDGDARLDVRFPQCIVPETFRDVPEGGVDVTAEGMMKDGYFEATNIMAKCASKYDPKTHTFEGQEQAKAPTN